MTAPKQVLVVGMGISGLAMARWCARAGDHVTLIDTREDAARFVQVQGELPAVTVMQGPLDRVLGADAAWSAIYVSPGLSPAHLLPVQRSHARRVERNGESSSNRATRR